MYIKAILWMSSWPLLIIVAYQLVKLAVKKYESSPENVEGEQKK